MMKIDKSTEPDATAALLKLKQKEQVGSRAVIYLYTWDRQKDTKTSILIPILVQEVERKARKQFKGLFDKKPGEIAEVQADEDKDDQTSESKKDGEVHGDSDGTSSEDSHEAAPDAPQMGWFSRFGPTRFLSSLGLQIQRCTILWFNLRHTYEV